MCVYLSILSFKQMVCTILGLVFGMCCCVAGCSVWLVAVLLLFVVEEPFCRQVEEPLLEMDGRIRMSACVVWDMRGWVRSSFYFLLLMMMSFFGREYWSGFSLSISPFYLWILAEKRAGGRVYAVRGG